jgi:hypothetical protein
VRVILMSLVTDRLLALLGLVAVAGAVWYWQFDAVDRSVGRQIAVLGTIAVVAAAIALWLMPALKRALAKRWPRLHAVRSRRHRLCEIARNTNRR